MLSIAARATDEIPYLLGGGRREGVSCGGVLTIGIDSIAEVQERLVLFGECRGTLLPNLRLRFQESTSAHVIRLPVEYRYRGRCFHTRDASMEVVSVLLLERLCVSH